VSKGRRSAIDDDQKGELAMWKSVLYLPAIVFLLGGCPWDDPKVATTPPVTTGDLKPDERGVSVLAQAVGPGLTEFDGMALSDNYLFLAMNWHGVYKMPKFGGPVEVLDADDSALFQSLVTNGTDVVWQKTTFDSNPNGTAQVKRQAVDGGPTQILFAGPNPVMWRANRASLVNVAVDSGVQLTTAPLAGGASPSPRVVQDFNGGPGVFDWAVDDTFAYVWEASVQSTTVARYPLAGGDGMLLAQFDSPASASIAPAGSPVEGTVLLDDDYVYVRTTEGIRRVPKSGGEASFVYRLADNELSGSANPLGALDGTSLFFDMSRDNAAIIASVPKGGGPAVDLRFDMSHWNYPWQMLESDGYLFMRSLDLSHRNPDGSSDILQEKGVILLVPKTPPSTAAP
jgi:hypothetical protein